MLTRAADFVYFNRGNQLFKTTRPLELLFRDPWWIITTLYLLVVIKMQYEMTLKDIVRISPRFGVMLAAMLLSIAFIICDLLSVTKACKIGGHTGINPFWKLAFVFKCLTDSVILDDFKMALDRLRAFKISRLGSFSGDFSDRRSRNDGNLVETWEQVARAAQKPPIMNPSSLGAPAPHDTSTDARGYSQASELAPGQRTQEKEGPVPPHQHATHFSNLSLDLDGIVPSALEDPLPRRLPEAHIHKQSNDEQIEDIDLESARHPQTRDDSESARQQQMADDYAHALRDVEGHSAPLSPSKSIHARRYEPN